jgi:eukaryotic-like serine/threonine-protein kinase
MPEITTPLDLTGLTVLGRYRLLRLLGTGGMGKVYLAQREGSSLRVVVKIMHEKFMEQQRFHELFVREMNFLTHFQHPHVVALLDNGVETRLGPCIVMEYVDGLPLSSLLKHERRFTPERTGRMLVQICSALHAAQHIGIVHRDMKPNNIMVAFPNTGKETLKVLDFGLAKLTVAPHLAVEELRGRGRRLMAVGTPEYICPEQLRGNEVDYRGDLYSVGVMLYEMLTGHRPYDSRTDEELFELHMRGAPVPFKNRGVNFLPPAIEAVVMSCLLKYPNDRPQSARALAEKYEDALGIKLIGEEFKIAAKTTTPLPLTPSASLQLDMPADPFTVTYHLQAWMPEAIAVIKLKGFLDDMCGDVIESQPGLVCVSLVVETERKKKQEPQQPAWMVWLGLAKKPPPEPEPEKVTMDIYMEKNDPSQANLLSITVQMRPNEGSRLVARGRWRTFCDKICDGLCQHLIANKVRSS